MTREGAAASTWSKNRRSMPAACLENTLKFTPPSTTVAPSGPGVPVVRRGAGGPIAFAGSDSSVLFIRSSLPLGGERRRSLRCGSSKLEKVLRFHTREQHHQWRDEPGPPGLMACTEARTVVALEVLVEQEVVAPVRIGLEHPRVAIHRPACVIVAKKDAAEAACNLFGDV